jgi:hypothetical protein
MTKMIHCAGKDHIFRSFAAGLLLLVLTSFLLSDSLSSHDVAS